MQQGVRVLLRSFRFALVMVMALGLIDGGIKAQDSNLLRDGGFEGTYTNRGRADLDLPADWSMWIAESPHAEDWMNLPPGAAAYSGTQPSPHGGAQALAVSKSYATFTAAVYQQVSVDPDTNLSASAFAFLRTCKIPAGADTCTSTSDSNAYARIGIDPNGGTNPFDADVVWSANAAPYEEWQQMTVEATSTGSTVTLFLYTTQQWPYQINTIYWDDAVLSLGGTGGAAAAAPGAPTSQPTSAASGNTQASERVVHIVQANETLDSIAFSYGKTREELLAINNIADPRIIQIGQEIIISLPPTPTPTPSPEGFELTLAATTPTLLPAIRDAAPAPVIEVTSVAGASPLDPALTSATICVTFFEDANQNRIQDGDEAALAGGQILLTRDGAPAGTHQTGAEADPYCFTELTPGSYDLQGVAPSGYGLTTPDQLHVSGYAGAQINVAFGAAAGVAPVEPPPADVSASGEIATPAADSGAASNGLTNNLGLIVFGVAGIVLIGGLGVTMVLLRRR